MSLFHSLTKALFGPPAAKSVWSPHKSFRPTLEALEDRAVPASHSISGSTLYVTGDSRVDTVYLWDNGTNGPQNVSLQLNGQQISIYRFINRIEVATGGGNDTVLYTLTGDLQAAQTRNLKVDLGTGNDRFEGMVRGDLIGNALDGAQLTMFIAGASGSDTMTVNAGVKNDADVYVGPNAKLSVTLDGGDNNDHLYFFYNGELDGQLDLIASGGNGDDNLNAFINLFGGSTGRLGSYEEPAELRGRAGADKLRFEIHVPSGGGPAIYARAVGGTGYDTIWVIDNGTVYSVP